jgi:hypothetical protein
MTPEQRAARAVRIRELREGGEIDAFLAQAEATYTESLLNAQDPAERERLWLAVQVVRKFGQHLAEAESAGRLVDHQAQEMRRLRLAR